MLERGQVIEMVLTGHYAGHTVLLNGHAFVKGVCKVYAYPESFTSFLTVMGRSYQAYPRGSKALQAAQERDEANGIQHHLQANPAPTDGTSGSVQGAGGTSSGSVPDPRALHSELDAPAEAGSARVVSERPGHTDAGMGERVESDTELESVTLMRAIQTAVRKLDPAAPEQWTTEGLPSVDAIATAVNNQTVTREMISAAMPDFDKRTAEDLAAF